MKNIKTYIWLHVKLKCSQIMNLMTQSSRQRAPKKQLWQLWRPLAAAIKVRFWRSMGRLEDLSCTQKNVWWLVSNPRPLGVTAPQKRKKTFLTANFVKYFVLIWKTPRIRGLNGRHYRQTSLMNFVGYLKAIRAGHILSQNIRKTCRNLKLKFAQVCDCNDSMRRVVVILFIFVFVYIISDIISNIQ